MRTAWAIFLLLQFFGLAAQTPAYLHYTVRDGLPGNFVHCGLQDRKGLLWFGTDKGLASFDGTRFRTYGVAEGLPDPEVLHFKEDSQGRLWLFCFRKKPCYMLNGRIFTEKEDPLLADIDFRTGTYTLTEKPDAGIWLAESTEKTYQVFQGNIKSMVFPDAVASFHQVGDAFLAMGMHSIMRISTDGSIKTLCRIGSTHDGAPSVCVKDNRILYALPNGLLLFEWTGDSIRKLAEIPHVSGQVYADQRGRFWVSSPALGAIVFDNTQSDLSALTYFLPNKKVNRVFEDSRQNLWFCTLNEGIFMLQRNAPLLFQNPQDFPSLNIRSIARSASGHLFTGDDAGNIHIFQGANHKIVSLGSVDGYNLVRQIIPFDDGTFWAASDEGLFQGSLTQTTVTTLISKASLKAVCRQENKNWIAAATALCLFDSSVDTLQTVINHRVTTVEADNDGNIWVGGIDGLYSQKDRFQLNWGDHFPELKNRIMAIRPTPKGKIWIVTPKDGLLSVSVRAGAITNVEVINRRLNTPIHNIQSLFVEPEGRVWLATNRGIYSLDQQMRVVQFNAASGLADDDVNAVLVHGDTLWAGTVSGLSRLVLRQPQETGDFNTHIVGIQYRKNKQAVYRYLLDSARATECLEIPADASMLELQLAGLDFSYRGNLRFELVQTEVLLPVYCWTFSNLLATMIGNSDTTWEESGLFQFGVHIPPGKYAISTTAVKASGIKSRFPDQLILLKYPYWYETVWFFLLIWGVITYVIWRFYRVRLAYQKIIAAAANLQLQALQSQMSPHFIGNTVNAIQQFLHPPDPEKTSEYIAAFVRLLRRTMEYSEKPVITFGEEMEYLREYLKLVELRFENKFRYEIHGAETIPSNTPIPSMLLQPLLENATLHGMAPDGPSVLQLVFAFEGERLSCSVTDNGVGITAAQHNKQAALLVDTKRESKGLDLLRKKVVSLNQLYHSDLTLSVQDLSETDSTHTGTKIVITYLPNALWKNTAKYPTPPPPLAS